MQQMIHFSSDDYRLSGILHLPEVNNPPVIIGSHGLFSTGDSPKQIALAEQCVKKGMAFFRFDHRGCGRSEGDFFTATTFAGRFRDLIQAVELMKTRFKAGEHVGLFGSSFGGAVCLAFALQLGISAIVTVAAPLCSESIHSPATNEPTKNNLMENLDKDALFFDIRKRFDHLSHLLIFHGDLDAVVPFSNALELYAMASEPKQLVQQDGGDHPMSNPEHQRKFVDLTSGWFEKYLSF